MIHYRPTDGDPQTTPQALPPRTAFLMTQLGGDIPGAVDAIRSDLAALLAAEDYALIDAGSEVTGRDFLLKIWQMATTVPVGVAIIHEEMRSKTVNNVFYELGLMQAYGKETVVVKTENASVPSDLVRTEYIEYGSRFDDDFQKFLSNLREQAQYYAKVAGVLDEGNPLLAIDYLRRAYLIAGEEAWRQRAREIFDEMEIEDRAQNSVEMLLAHFCTS